MHGRREVLAVILPRRFLFSGRGPNRFITAPDVMALTDTLLVELACEPEHALRLAAQAWATGKVAYGLLTLELR